VTFKVIQGQRFISNLTERMPLPISDQQQHTPYLAPFSHNTSVTNDKQTDGRTTTTTTARPLLKSVD